MTGAEKGPRLRRCVFSILIVSSLAVGPLQAQEIQHTVSLTLKQAVDLALEKNPDRKAAIADTKAAAADVKEARSVLLPQAVFTETATRGTDPVYVFGSKLRQERFTTADFALNVLNTPAPFNNFSTHFGGTWSLFDSFASWRGVSRAKHMEDAMGHQLDRANQLVVFRVVNSYFGVLLAKKRLELAREALKTAQAVLERSRNRYESGIVVEADYLSAQVRVATRRQDLIRARNDAAMARADWNTAMGVSAEADYDVSENLTEKTLTAPKLKEAEKEALEMRPDLKTIRSEQEAQNESVSIAKARFGPRLSACGDWEADNPNLVTGGGGNDWLAGIELQFDLFQGGARRAELAHMRALQQKIAAAKESAADAVQLEVRHAYYELDAASQELSVARAAIAESQESLRINQNRYQAGLSTITDLLAAEEASQRSQADYWQDVYRYYTSFANLELASGTLSPSSPVVMR